MSVQTGHGSISPSSIFATKFAIAKVSISTIRTFRKAGKTRLSPSPIPPYPAQSSMCVIVSAVSTLTLVSGLKSKCRTTPQARVSAARRGQATKTRKNPTAICEKILCEITHRGGQAVRPNRPPPALGRGDSKKHAKTTKSGSIL